MPPLSPRSAPAPRGAAGSRRGHVGSLCAAERGLPAGQRHHAGHCVGRGPPERMAAALRWGGGGVPYVPPHPDSRRDPKTHPWVRTLSPPRGTHPPTRVFAKMKRTQPTLGAPWVAAAGPQPHIPMGGGGQRWVPTPPGWHRRAPDPAAPTPKGAQPPSLRKDNRRGSRSNSILINIIDSKPQYE